MPLTTEPSTPGSDIRLFYDALAPEYDLMTNFEKRFIQERPFFRFLVEKYRIRTALDAGCGTGFHSLLLAQLGVDVTAVDISPKMLRIVEQHAAEMGLAVRTVEASFQKLLGAVDRQVDLVVSMGNSLAHLTSAADLRAALRHFHDVTRPGGILFLQNLNYDRIMSRRETIQSVKESEQTTFVRFYEYGKDVVFFNILTLRRQNGSISRQRETIRLRPILKKELESSLYAAGFDDVRFYGAISLSEFIPDDSKDLVVVARKKELGK